MRKIDKTCTLSKEYKQWEENLPLEHPVYNSSKNKYYTDVIAQLLFCQKGLCAYTEELLCDERVFDVSFWKKNRYNSSKPKFMGELDHFDPLKKKTKGWEWNNFLIASTHINQKVKGSYPIDNILKPDHVDYDEYKLLYYNPLTHRFAPHPNLIIDEYKRVKRMIEVLGINFSPIVRKRKQFLSIIFRQIPYGINVPITQFITAYKMSIAHLNKDDFFSVCRSF